MPFSLTSVALGFVIGVIATAIVWNLTQRTVRNPERTRLTSVWGLEEVTAPGEPVRLVAQRIDGVEVPKGARLLVPRSAQGALPQGLLARAEVRMHASVHANYAVGRTRALVFASHIFPRAEAIWTMEPAVVQHLQEEFARLWGEAEPYFAECAIADAPAHEGQIVGIAGLASELVEFRGQKMLRVSQGGAVIGVLAGETDVGPHQGGAVRVVGKVMREGTATYMEALRIERIERGPAAHAPRARAAPIP